MDPERAGELLAQERERIERALGGLAHTDTGEEADEIDPGNLASDLYQDARDGVIAFGLVVGRLVGHEPLRNPDDLASERLQLKAHRLILDPALGVEDTRGRRDGDDVGDGPAAGRPGGELHRVDRLQPLS